ncbi:hypothetical protein M436DRAFT_86617 [Aureobasidium namibiae CBS 147.97]|uniref:Uncharacterized protein n=1 Tax=Aureobasidium namibiae CBS 147.97 TaxID=1043004 RepID=A0A074W9C1_9PEZI
MCSIVSDAIKNFENQGEKEKLANDALDMMMELAEQQMAASKLKVTNGNVDTKHIPIGQILYEDWQVRCTVSTDVTAIGDIIKDSYSAFAKGNMADGIASVLAGGLKIVMGTYVGNKSTREVYSITTGDLGGLQRADIRIFAYRFTASQSLLYKS